MKGRSHVMAGCGDGGIRVERGPDWLFVGLGSDAVERGDLADGVCRLVQESMAHRIVLELDRVQAVVILLLLPYMLLYA